MRVEPWAPAGLAELLNVASYSGLAAAQPRLTFLLLSGPRDAKCLFLFSPASTRFLPPGMVLRAGGYHGSLGTLN